MDPGRRGQPGLVRRGKQQPGKTSASSSPSGSSTSTSGGGWALGTAPIITGNWEADSDNRWVIPWGLQISKVSHVGSRPINVLIGYYRNSEHPEGGADSQVRFQINFLFPQASP